jgi:hypothetical protein
LSGEERHTGLHLRERSWVWAPALHGVELSVSDDGGERVVRGGR